MQAADRIRNVALVGHRGSGKTSLHEALLLEHLERPVDARHAHPVASAVKPVAELAGRDSAADLCERPHHGGPRAARAIARPLEAQQSVFAPVHGSRIGFAPL